MIRSRSPASSFRLRSLTRITPGTNQLYEQFTAPCQATIQIVRRAALDRGRMVDTGDPHQSSARALGRDPVDLFGLEMRGFLPACADPLEFPPENLGRRRFQHTIAPSRQFDQIKTRVANEKPIACPRLAGPFTFSLAEIFFVLEHPPAVELHRLDDGLLDVDFFGHIAHGYGAAHALGSGAGSASCAFQTSNAVRPSAASAYGMNTSCGLHMPASIIAFCTFTQVSSCRQAIRSALAWSFDLSGTFDPARRFRCW